MAIKTCIITGYGINTDEELAEAFRMSGSEAIKVHAADFLERPAMLKDYSILAFPGGFSFGDHIGSGKVVANLFRKRARAEIAAFVADGGLVLGICNGFQVLAKMGILPNFDGNWTQTVTLIHNASGKFIDRWVTCDVDGSSRCVWTKGLSALDMPIRHGEGRFVAAGPDVLARLESEGHVALRYRGENPNGSEGGIAGVCDATGRVLGLMPHPEGFLRPENHPQWRVSPTRPKPSVELIEKGVRFAENTR